ncbi:hypothetical protein U9M48_004615, partial [Paspalum notatum var. saurae]
WYDNLKLLDLLSNKLQGALPDGLGNLKQLVVMKLQMNNLSAYIPNSFSNMKKLEICKAKWKDSSSISSMQSLLTLALGINELTGLQELPSSMGTLSNLVFLDLSDSNLSGQVPSCKPAKFIILFLSYNQLSGPLPDFPRWVMLNLSRNPGLKK